MGSDPFIICPSPSFKHTPGHMKELSVSYPSPLKSCISHARQGSPFLRAGLPFPSAVAVGKDCPGSQELWWVYPDRAPLSSPLWALLSLRVKDCWSGCTLNPYQPAVLTPNSSQNAPLLKNPEQVLGDRLTPVGDTQIVLLAIATPSLSPWACPMSPASGL